MNSAPTDGCTGYWYNVQAKTPTAPAAYKCLTQAEYDNVMAQQAAAEHYDNVLIGIVLLVTFGIALATLATYWIVKLIRKNK